MTTMQDDLKMPKMALGAWAWGSGMAGGDQVFGHSLTKEDLKPVFDKALELGLNLWDTAAAYGMGSSEEILGEFIKDAGRDKVIISTKFTPQLATDSPNTMEENFEASAKRLNSDYFDIYWIHNPADVEKWTNKIIPLAKSGKIKYIGVSNHDLEELKLANSILQKEGLKVSAVQNHFSLLNRSSESSGILDYCKENDITFFSYMVLEQGALSGKYDTNHPFPEGSDRGKVYNDSLPQLEKLVNFMKEIADNHNASVAQIGTAWAIAKGTTPIVGVTKISHVEDAAKSAQLKLSDDEIKSMETLADETKVKTVREWEKTMK
ncbi:aldo/keto reductase [Companilactobacillus metriopterae]|uniref:aldo/keto reductase n=1 Tax=Companilactobacillus metriopterae TaxID=1909267 RepID=UPI00100BA3A5|nr:aldo/keto reductase [Companilactobacillus metriopterae]